MNTKRQAKIVWLNQLASVLEAIWKENVISKEFVECKPNEKYFDDSVKFSNLTHEIFELSHTLRNMARYSTMIEESEN